jgi:hypothetical protein
VSETFPAPDPLTGPVGGDELAFRVDGVGYRWAHVFAHARRRGDWRILEIEVTQAQACLRLATEEGPPLRRQAERSVAVAFRRTRRLHAAEDLEAWLGTRDLTFAQWRHYIQGEALRRRHAAELDTVVKCYPVDDATVEEALRVWGRCSEAFPRWAEQLATRAAAAHAACERAGEPPPGPDELEALEALFDRFAGDVATAERLEALLATRYLDWLRIDGETAVFADQDTAAEALLCVRDDGWSLSEATLAGQGRLHRHGLLVEEIEPDTRYHFVRAHDGDLLGPLPLGGKPTLFHVLRKDAPSLDDDEVRLKATRHVVTTAASHEVDDRVEWLHPR